MTRTGWTPEEFQRALADLDPQADLETLRQNISIYHQEVEYQNQELQRVNTELDRALADAKDLFVRSPVALAVLDGDLKIVRWNDQMDEALRLNTSPAGRSFASFFSPEDQDQLHIHFRQLLKGQSPEPLLVKIHRPRATTWYELTSRWLEAHPEGPVRVSLTNLTGVIRAEERLATSEEQFRSLFEATNDGVLLVDEAGQVVRANPAAAALLGQTSDQIHGQVLWDVWPSESREWSRAVLARQLATVSPLRAGEPTPFRWKTSGGDDRSGTVQALCLSDRRPRLYALVLRDETERNRWEERRHQSQKLEAMGQVTGSIAHDFNNLLAVILSRLDILSLRAAEAPHLQADLKKIRDAADQSAHIVRQLLLFARKQVTTPRPTNLKDAIDPLVPVLQDLAGNRCPVQFVPPLQEVLVRIDPAQLKQVLINLVTNARDAMAEGGPITITVAEGLEEIVLTVEDQGTGIPTELLPRVTEPFFTTKPVGHGTGLGLATVYSIVSQLEGELAIDSAPGRGTKISIHLRRSLPEAVPEPPPPPTQRIAWALDDNAEVLELVGLALESWGFRVSRFESAEQLSAAWASGQAPAPALLVCDVLLPGQSGPELVDELRPLLPELRVLFISGYSDDRLQASRLDQRTTQFLAKPFNLGSLQKSVQSLLGDGVSARRLD